MLTSGNVPGPPRFTVLSSDGKLGVGLGTRLVRPHTASDGELKGGMVWSEVKIEVATVAFQQNKWLSNDGLKCMRLVVQTGLASILW